MLFFIAVVPLVKRDGNEAVIPDSALRLHRFVILCFVLFLQDMVNKLQVKRMSCSGLLTVYLAWEMSRILEAVHNAQIIHGDVKPDNFMIVHGLAFFIPRSFSTTILSLPSYLVLILKIG